MNRGRIVLVAALTATGTAGCSETGKVNVQLSPVRGSSQSLTHAAVQVHALQEQQPIPAQLFEMKILSAYLTEDVDPVSMNNIGRSERIWVNPACPNANDCRDSHVGYFDLSDPEQANRQLNEQGLEIATGSYRYVRVAFCIGGAQGNIVRYKTAAMTAAVEAAYGGCAVTSERLEPAVEVQDGDAITIALEYDLNKQPLYYVAGSPTCGSLDTNTPCLGGIVLTPKVVR